MSKPFSGYHSYKDTRGQHREYHFAAITGLNVKGTKNMLIFSMFRHAIARTEDHNKAAYTISNVLKELKTIDMKYLINK